MTTPKENEIKVSIVAGPNEMQLMMSLVRPYQGPYGIEMDKATSVQFTMQNKPIIIGFRACLNGIFREDGSGNRWNLDGYVFDYPGFREFHGYYDSKTRTGCLTLKAS